MEDETNHNITSKVGGKRAGAGRKTGSGTYLEPTTVLRVPISQKPVVASYLDAYAKKQKLQKLKVDLVSLGDIEVLPPELSKIGITLYESKVPAGFPSPADDHVEKRLEATVKATQQHSRALTVHFKNNTTLAIKLDKGVSFWRVNNKLNRYSTSNHFDFSMDEMQQAKNISNLREILVEGESVPTEIFIKIR